MVDLTQLVEMLVEHGKAHARKILIERGETSLTPICNMFDRQGGSIIIVVRWSNDFEKQGMIAALRRKAKEMDAKAVLYISEAWFYHPNDGDDLIPASQHPKRLECVSIYVTDGTHTKYVLLEMIRDPHTERVTDLIERKMPEGLEIESIFDGIIPSTTQ